MARRGDMVCLSVGFGGDAAVREVADDAVPEAVRTGAADASLAHHQEKLPRVVHLARAVAAEGDMVSERGQKIVFHLIVEEQEQYRSDLFAVHYQPPEAPARCFMSRPPCNRLDQLPGRAGYFRVLYRNFTSRLGADTTAWSYGLELILRLRILVGSPSRRYPCSRAK